MYSRTESKRLRAISLSLRSAPLRPGRWSAKTVALFFTPPRGDLRLYKIAKDVGHGGVPLFASVKNPPQRTDVI